MDNATLKFLQTLNRIYKARLTHRDVLVLNVIINEPGLCGQDIADKMGAGSRSNISRGIDRMISIGFLEDRREIVGHAKPQILHALPPGIEFFNSLKFWEKP